MPRFCARIKHVFCHSEIKTNHDNWIVKNSTPFKTVQFLIKLPQTVNNVLKKMHAWPTYTFHLTGFMTVLVLKLQCLCVCPSPLPGTLQTILHILLPLGLSNTVLLDRSNIILITAGYTGSKRYILPRPFSGSVWFKFQIMRLVMCHTVFSMTVMAIQMA